jgi:hypothetical protein
MPDTQPKIKLIADCSAIGKKCYAMEHWKSAMQAAGVKKWLRLHCAVPKVAILYIEQSLYLRDWQRLHTEET